MYLHIYFYIYLSMCIYTCKEGSIPRCSARRRKVRSNSSQSNSVISSSAAVPRLACLNKSCAFCFLTLLGYTPECVAVCCRVLQCVAVCCSVLQCDAVWCSVLQCVALCCSMLQCVAACCSVLQCVAACCSVLQCVLNNA